MPFVSLVVELAADGAERLSDALLEAGALSISVDDPLAGTAAETPVFDEPGWQEEGRTHRWQRMRLKALFEAAERAQLEAILAAAASEAGLDAPPPFEIEWIDDEDWVRKTQSQFEPIRISDRLWIVPSWHQPPDSQAINIALDPGIAFGTGSHPTTKLCLRWLESHVGNGQTVLDYGCGSGILAIAASHLGAGQVVGVDIDPGAVDTARDNALRNNVQSAQFRHVSEPLQIQADIVVANILTNPLKLLAPALASCCRPGGSIALSGILETQASEVIATYEPWFQLEPAGTDDGWVCLAGTRR